MRSLATALEAYFADFGTYPQAEALVRWSENPDAVYSMRGGRLFAVGKRLTTPVAYIGQRFYFEDVFADASKAPFGYLARADGWILISAGPDKDYDIDPLRHYSPGPDAEKAPALLLRTYDPTNGSISAGDIWRVKQ